MSGGCEYLTVCEHRHHRHVSESDLRYQVNNVRMNIRWIASIPNSVVWSYSEHVHTCPEFHLVAQGECLVSCGGRLPTLVRAGQIYIVPPGLPHSQLSKADNPAAVYAMNCDINVEEGSRAADGTEMPAGSEVYYFRYLQKSGELIIADDTFGIRGLYERIFEEERDRYPGYRASIQMLTYQIAVDSMRAFMKAKALPHGQPEPDVDQQRMEQIDRIIMDNLAGNLTIKEIADRVYLSERQISRTVLNVRAKPLHQYILDMKCEKALVYLGDPRRRVQEVADLLGFSSSHHLSRYFKRRFGMMPREYQKIQMAKRMS